MHSSVRASRRAAVWLPLLALCLPTLLGAPARAATFTVGNTGDSGAGSLRQALAAAAASADPSDVITFDPATFGTTPQTITLTTGELAVGKSVSLNGPGKDLLTVDGGRRLLTAPSRGGIRSAAVASSTARVFHVLAGTAQISGLTATDGFSGDIGAGVVVESGAALTLSGARITNCLALTSGGGLYVQNGGSATLTDCEISGNTANGGRVAGGGGIMNLGALVMTGSTLSGNRVGQSTLTGVGGGLATMAPTNTATSTLTNCTLANNAAATGGGAFNAGVIAVVGGGGIVPTSATTTLTDCTVTGNLARSEGGGLDQEAGVFTLQATLVAGNASASDPDVFADVDAFTSTGSNLIGVDDNQPLDGLAGGVNNDQVGTSAAPINPQLGPLQDNGGPTPTVALLAASPAVDADFSLAPPARDQRGVSRPQGVRADIGAFELTQQQADTTPPVTTPALRAASYFNGYFRGPVTVTLTATDTGGSGVAATFYRVDSGPQQTYTGPFTVSGDFAHLVTFYSTDNAGNAEGPAKSATFSIDSTPPVTTITGRAVPGGTEITLKDADNFSGPGGTFYRIDSGPQQTYSGPFVVGGPGQHLVTAYSMDRALNAEGPNKSLSVTNPGPPPPPDTTPPVTTPALSGPSYVNGYYRGPVTVTLTATDDRPGPLATFYRVDSGAQQTYTGPFTVSGDFRHLVTFYSTDRAGNAESPNGGATFSIDSTPPVTSFTGRPTPAGEEVTLTDRDNFSGPGGTFYRVDSGPQQTYSGPFTVPGNFTHLLTFYSLDRAGNAEGPARSATFTVNTDGATTTAQLSGAPGLNGYFHGPVTVTLRASDSTGIVGTFYRVDSGPQQTYTAPFVVSGEFTHLVTFFSTDGAGVPEPSRSATFGIDSVAPVTTASPSGSRSADGTFRGPVSVSLFASDAVSGVSGTFYRVDSGPQQTYNGPFAVSGDFAHLVTFFSVDRAGNAESSEASTFAIAAPAPAPVKP